MTTPESGTADGRAGNPRVLRVGVASDALGLRLLDAAG